MSVLSDFLRIDINAANQYFELLENTDSAVDVVFCLDDKSQQSRQCLSAAFKRDGLISAELHELQKRKSSDGRADSLCRRLSSEQTQSAGRQRDSK